MSLTISVAEWVKGATLVSEGGGISFHVEFSACVPLLTTHMNEIKYGIDPE